MLSGTFYSSSPGVYMGVGFLFSFFLFLSLSVAVFLHSEASSKCNFRRGVLSQCLGRFALRSGCPMPVTSVVTPTLAELRG